MTSNQQLPIIIDVDERDDITHTAEWPQCKDMTCPCQLEVEDEIALTFPSEEQLDEQERSVLSQDEPAYDAPHCPQCGHLYAKRTQEHRLEQDFRVVPLAAQRRGPSWQNAPAPRAESREASYEEAYHSCLSDSLLKQARQS